MSLCISSFHADLRKIRTQTSPIILDIEVRVRLGNVARRVSYDHELSDGFSCLLHKDCVTCIRWSSLSTFLPLRFNLETEGHQTAKKICSVWLDIDSEALK